MNAKSVTNSRRLQSGYEPVEVFPDYSIGTNILLFSCLIRIRQSYYSLFGSALTNLLVLIKTFLLIFNLAVSFGVSAYSD